MTLPPAAHEIRGLKGMGGAPIRRTPARWSHGPHDTVPRIHPKTVTGFRLARAEN